MAGARLIIGRINKSRPREGRLYTRKNESIMRNRGLRSMIGTTIYELLRPTKGMAHNMERIGNAMRTSNQDAQSIAESKELKGIGALFPTRA